MEEVDFEDIENKINDLENKIIELNLNAEQLAEFNNKYDTFVIDTRLRYAGNPIALNGDNEATYNFWLVVYKTRLIIDKPFDKPEWNYLNAEQFAEEVAD